MGPEHEFPNEIYEAYEKLPSNPFTEMPRYRRVDIENKLKLNHALVQKHRHQKNFSYLGAKSKGLPGNKNRFGFCQAQPFKTDAYSGPGEQKLQLEGTTAIIGKNIEEKEVVPRKAITLEYLKRKRRLRALMGEFGEIDKKTLAAFHRENIRNMLRMKAKHWTFQRRDMWYKRQLKGRTDIAKW